MVDGLANRGSASGSCAARRTNDRYWRIGAAVLALGVGCSSPRHATEPDGGHPVAHEPTPDVGVASDAEPAPLPLPPMHKGSFREHPARVAWVFDDEPDAPNKLEIGQAEARGYTIVDLSNSWVPFIFSEKTPGEDDSTTNRFRATYIALANDEVDSDGDALREHERNYLELYGIPPSLKVVKDEWDFVDGNVESCLEQAGFDPSVFARHKGTIAYRDARSVQVKRKRAADRWHKKLVRAMKHAKLDPDLPEDMSAAATHPKTRTSHAKWRENQDEVDVIDHAQRRFRCERMFVSGDGTGEFEPGIYGSGTTHALANFERKHDLKGWGHFKADNKAVLGQTPDETTHARLLRVIAERVVAAAGIVEDGSASKWKKDFRWTDSDGQEHALRDLADEYTRATVRALGLETPQSAKARLGILSDLGPGDFENLLVAVKMPPLPAYYADSMAFSVYIDRGDVWYDFPYDDLGAKKSQPRRRYPTLTLYAEYLEQKIPLVHWRTTIGSWRSEVLEGETLLKYKNSDVGARVWKDIVAAPVWIPPATTPPAELIKGKYRRGKFTRDVNYDEIGPGYRSAYGLVAAYHIRQIVDEDGNITSEFDNSIRTHGSVDYMSILRRYSHGCHRLYNMDAVRMFSFILRHRPYARHGQQSVGVGRTLEITDDEGNIETYNLRIDTRGYKYELVEPIPVMVGKGRIKGRRKSPIVEYLRRPIPLDENEITVDDGAGGSITIPIPIPFPPLLP